MSPLPVTTFNTPDGNPLSNGYLLINLSEDASINNEQICAGASVRVPLDSNGVVIDTPLFPPNASLQPSGTVYTLRAYTVSGSLVANTVVTVV